MAGEFSSPALLKIRFRMVRAVGIEPTLCLQNRILSFEK